MLNCDGVILGAAGHLPWVSGVNGHQSHDEIVVLTGYGHSRFGTFTHIVGHGVARTQNQGEGEQQCGIQEHFFHG